MFSTFIYCLHSFMMYVHIYHYIQYYTINCNYINYIHISIMYLRFYDVFNIYIFKHIYEYQNNLQKRTCCKAPRAHLQLFDDLSALAIGIISSLQVMYCRDLSGRKGAWKSRKIHTSWSVWVTVRRSDRAPEPIRLLLQIPAMQ